MKGSGAMKPFTIQVTGITKKEYFQACRISALRLYRILAVVMVVVCGCILLASGQITPAALLAPVGVYLLVVLVAEFAPRLSYKGQLEQIEGLEYEFGPLCWAVIAQGERAEFDWIATPKLVKYRDCLFLYSEDTRSSLLPRRLLAPEQEEQILQWYQGTRHLAKEYERKQMGKERQKRRAATAKARRDMSGPAWGPLKNRRKK